MDNIQNTFHRLDTALLTTDFLQYLMGLNDC